MPMLRNLHSAQAWNTQGYVCRACRHKLLAARQKRARFHSTYTPFQESGDDWFSNFNELSAESSSSKPKDDTGGADKDVSKESSIRKAQTRRQRIRTQSSESFQRNGSFDSLKSKLSSRLRNDADPKKDRGGHELASKASESTNTANAVDKTPVGERKRVRLHPGTRSLQLDAQPFESSQRARDEQIPRKAGDASAEKTSVPPKNKSIDDIIKELQEQFRVKLPEMIEAAVNRDKKIKGRERIRVQSSPDVISTTAGLTSDGVTSDVTDSPQLEDAESNDTKLGSIMERFQKSAPYGASSAISAENDVIRPIPDNPDPIGMPRFASMSSPIPSYSSAVSAPTSARSWTVTQRLEESINRPKWGGVGSSSESAKDADPEFLNSLQTIGSGRAAQKLQAKSSLPQSAADFADSPTDLVEMQVSYPAKDKEATVFADSKVAAPSKTPAHTMESLQKGLSLELQKESAQPENQQDKVSPAEHSIEESVATQSESFTSPFRKSMKSGPRVRMIRDVAESSEKATALRARDLAMMKHRMNAEESSSVQSLRTDVETAEESELPQSDLASEALAKLHSSAANKLSLGLTREDQEAVEVKKPSEKPTEGDKAPESTKIDRTKLRRMRKHPAKGRDTGGKAQSVDVSSAPSKQKESTSTGNSDGNERRTPDKTTTTSVSQTSRHVTGSSANEGPAVQPSSSSPAMSHAGPGEIVSVDPSGLEVTPLDIPQPTVPGLEYGLDRVLFNPGVYQLQDPHSRVYNFDPYLQKIMPVVEFDYNALKEYKTSSQDTALSALAKKHGKRYIGSTSSMTGTLGHFHYLLSSFRPLNLNMLSRGFPDKRDNFTNINQAPNAIFLRWKGEDTYAIDADKEYDGANVLMMLGKSMEKLLTLPTSEYERYKKENSHSVSEAERSAPESYDYTTMGDFLMRSQLDAHDSRLPGTGMFDLKTRAVVSVRMKADDFQPMTGYQIHTLQGRFESYEREYYDMIRSTMLKYMLQARMGRMEGIFVAYHNVERIFGFQYIPLHEMDRAIHGQAQSCLGDQEFKLSLEMMNKIFDKATAKFPGQSLRFHFEATREAIGASETTVMWIYAEPMAEDEIDRIQSKSKTKVAEFERTMMGIEKDTETSADGVGARVSTDAVKEDVASSESAKILEPELATLSPDESSTPGDKVSGINGTQDYSTTKSNADPIFTERPELSGSRELMPLYVASIICQSKVDGTVVHRPEKLKPEDKWEVEYLFQEWATNESSWSRYADTKTRRKQLFEKYREEDEDDEKTDGESAEMKKRERSYIDWLQSMSQRGREYRGRMDQLEAGKVPVVIGQPLFASTEAVGEEIEDVDQYMDWMYQKGRH